MLNNIMDFGASPENTDNKAAIQAAIDASGAGIYVPAGVFRSDISSGFFGVELIAAPQVCTIDACRVFASSSFTEHVAGSAGIVLQHGPSTAKERQ